MTNEPSAIALAGRSPLRVAKRLFLATRPMFISASILPVLLGTASGWRAVGQLDGGVLLIGLAAIACVHAAGNVINDVNDDRGGTDRVNEDRIFPFTGGSRFIQNEIMSRRGMMQWGLALVALGGVLGAVLLAIKGVGLVFFGLAGGALFAGFLMPPLSLETRGLGEAAVGLGFGVLPVITAEWLQAGTVTTGGLLLSLPVALWIANVLLINEVPDARADGGTGKRTLVVILGLDRTRGLYLGLNGLALLAVLVVAGTGVLPPVAIAGPAALFLAALPASRAIGPGSASHAALTRGIKITLVIHAAGTLWLAAWVVAG